MLASRRAVLATLRVMQLLQTALYSWSYFYLLILLHHASQAALQGSVSPLLADETDNASLRSQSQVMLDPKTPRYLNGLPPRRQTQSSM